MSKTETPTTRLARRTALQVSAAKAHLADILVESGETTLELKGSPSEVGKAVRAAVAANPDRGAKTALASIARAAEEQATKAPAKATPGKANGTGAAKKGTPAKANEAKTVAKAKADAKADDSKPTTGPRGELLDRKGAPLADGYTVTVGFREFEVAKHESLGKAEGRWGVLCVLHDRFHVLTGDTASASEAERQGSRKARATWCGGCQSQGASAAAVAKDDAKNTKAPAAKAPAKKSTPAKATAKAPAKKATPAKAKAKATKAEKDANLRKVVALLK
jgi:hypothetical protein